MNKTRLRGFYFFDDTQMRKANLQLNAAVELNRQL